MPPLLVRFRLGLLVSIAIFALLLAGCGGMGSTTITPKPAPTATPPLDPSITQIVVKATDAQAVEARTIILDTMPAGFLPGNKRVTITTLTRDQAPILYKATTGKAMGNIAGWFLKRNGGSDPAIYFVGDGWGDYLRHMSLHEWAHFVQLENCTEAEFQAWRVAYTSAVSRGALPSEYAKVNEYEGWAEAVATIYEGKALDPEMKAVVDTVLERMTNDRSSASRSHQELALSSSGFVNCEITVSYVK